MRGRMKCFAVLVVMSLVLIPPMVSFAEKINMPTYFTPTDVERCLPKFIGVVSEVTDGKVDIKPFPINALIPIKDYLEATRRGAVKVSLFPEGYYEKQVPVSTIASGLPFACRDLDEARYFMREKGFVDLLREGYRKLGIYIIPYETYRVGLMTKTPITKMDDFKGMKLRSYGPPLCRMADENGCLDHLHPGRRALHGVIHRRCARCPLGRCRSDVCDAIS